ncbi:MAG: glycosyltransferase family 2 protein [Candidatus Omnitrophota bacterium]
MKTCVLIPAYNEARAIGSVVRKIKEEGFAVIVVDDGSFDDTAKKAAESGALVMRHIKNLGKGASLKEGFEHITRMTDFEAVIIMDGDGQHNPADIKKFMARAEEFGEDLIMGNRMTLVKDMPFVRLATNRFTSFLLSTICAQHIPDTQCGFRLIKRGVLNALKLESNKYDLESEMLIKASREKFKISSVPVETIYRGETSNIHPIKDALRFMFLLVKSYFN